MTAAKKCLIVDDSKIVRKISRKIIEAVGYEVVEAENGQEALDLFVKETPQLIMLDWNMPVMTGIECLKALRALPGGDAPVVIFCTTENSMERITEAIVNGANEFVMKPFDEAIIRDKLSQLGLL